MKPTMGLPLVFAFVALFARANGPTPDQVGTISQVLFDPNSSNLYIAGGKGVQKWNWGENQIEPVFSGEPSHVMAQTDSGGTLAFAKSLSEFCVLDTQTQVFHTVSLQELPGQSKIVSSLSFTKDGKNILAGTTEFGAQWFYTSGQPSYDSQGSARAYAFGNQDATRAVCAGQTRESPYYAPNGDKVGLYTNTSNQMSADKWSGHTREINSMVLSADGQRLVTAAADGTLRFWNTASGQTTYTAVEHKKDDWGYNAYDAPSLSLSKDGNQVLSAGGGKVVLWDIAFLQKLKEFQVPNVKYATLSRDGKYFAAVTKDNKVMIFDLATGAKLAELQGGSSTTSAKPQMLKDVATGPATIGSLDIRSITTIPEKKKILVTTLDELVILNDSGPQTVVESRVPYVSEPSQLIKAGSEKLNLHFAADDGAHGWEIWTTDGTAEGTQLYVDARPGADSGALTPDPLLDPQNAPPQIAYTMSAEYFFAKPPADDATPGGVATLYKKQGDSIQPIMTFKSPLPRDLQYNKDDGYLYFSANDGTGSQLWRSDGTREGTRVVKYINPNPNYSSLYEKPFITPGVSMASGSPKNVLYFTATDGSTGWGVYQTDGTEAGTTKVKSFSPIYAPMYYIPTPNGQVFIAHDGSTGYEPWVTDGTEAGTKKLADLTTNYFGLTGMLYKGYNANWANIFSNMQYKGTLFTGYNDAGYNSLFVTDGTSTGTKVLHSASGSFNAVGSVTGGNQGGFYTQGTKLYKTDGTSAGTWVKSFPSSYAIKPPSNLTMLDDQVILSANDGQKGTEVWKSQPPYDANSTQMAVDAAKDQPPGSTTGLSENKEPQIISFPQMFFQIVFVLGMQLGTLNVYSSDGTPEGTQDYILKPKNASRHGSMSAHSLSATLEEGQPYDYVDIREYVFLDHRLVFVANDGITGLEPWVADGSVTGTLPLKDICPFNTQSAYQYIEGARFLTRFKNKIYFASPDIEDPAQWAEHLWETDGTTTGTRAVEPLDLINPQYLCVAGDVLYFAAKDNGGNYGVELYKTDGTAAGTALVKNINDSYLDSRPENLTACGDRVFFTAYQSGIGRELWVSDSTPAGTKLVKDITPASLDATWSNKPGRVGNLTCMNGLMFFTADNGTSGTELWRSDGTAAGTWLVKDIWPGAGASNPELLTVVSGPLAYETHDGELVVPGDFLYFSSVSPERGRELWKSDGTPEGTVLVRDIVPGTGSSLPAWITPVILAPGQAFFSAFTPETGRELWFTDGTEAGTQLFADINPGMDSSVPSQMIVRPMAQSADNVLFFMADDGVHGTEPWVVNPALPELSPTPTATPSPSPTESPTPAPTASPTAEASPSPSPTQAPTPTPAASPTPLPPPAAGMVK